MLGTVGSGTVALAKWLRAHPPPIPIAVGAALVVGSLLLLLLFWSSDPTPQDWPDGRPSVGVLVAADADPKVTVVGRYVVDDDRLTVEVGTCVGHDRVVVSFANVPYAIIEAASASWRESAVEAPIPIAAVEWEDGTSAVLLEAPADDPGCTVFALSLTGMDLTSSRGGKTLVETPTVRGCGAPTQGPVADDGTIDLDGIDGRWMPECTEGVGTHRVRIEPRPGQWVVRSEPLPVDPQHPYEFTGEAKVTLADDGAVRDREILDEILLVVLGIGIGLLINAGIHLFERRKDS